MDAQDYQQVCDSIARLSPCIRFTGVVGKNGDLLASYRRAEVIRIIDACMPTVKHYS